MRTTGNKAKRSMGETHPQINPNENKNLLTTDLKALADQEHEKFLEENPPVVAKIGYDIHWLWSKKISERTFAQKNIKDQNHDNKGDKLH